ncbi:MAG: efflux RND transporter periplasmic adaptor subunit [Patescibacteria group bacterium]|nr:efflux RND transporter periplasmic adaptor subunit [Patescibacteria group bacterium]
MSKKIIAILLLIVFVGIIGYLMWGKDKSLKNNFFIVEKQDLVQEISVVGKVKPVESINLAFERTGVLSSVFIETGQKVEKGTLLAQLDITDAEKRVEDAKVNLENAKLALDKINLQKEQLLRGDILNKVYEEGLTVLSGFYDKTMTILDSLDNILFGTELDGREQNIKYYAEYNEKFSSVSDRLWRLYQEAEKLHKDGLIDYQLAKRGSGDIRNKAIKTGYDLAVKLAEIIKSTRDIVRNLQDFLIKEGLVHGKESIINEHASTLAQYDLIVDGCLKNLIVIINTINDYYDTTESLPLEIKTQELLVKQRENELVDAKNNLAKYFLYSPINGVISRQDLRVGEVVTANVPVVEIISDSEFEIVADIYEEDIVKIEIGSLTEISLPAFPKKVFKGKVIFIEPAEKIVDGVVYYEIRIGFDEDPPKGIKPTMTADIIIQTEKRENVLVVPREAIKRVGGKTIVEVFIDDLIQEREVEVGLRGDEMVEIISGLEKGEKVFLR